MSWTVSKIVDQVNKRTENRAADKIDVRMEFFLGLDEFVNERHFWWRKRRGTFNTVIGSNFYDLAASAVSGSIQPGGGLTDFGELDEMILLNADGVTKSLTLTPIFDPVTQLAAINNNVQDGPSSYFIDTNSGLTVICLQAPANVAQKMLYTYWSVPQISDTTTPEDDTGDTIPLVPGYLQWGLIYMLERRIYEFLYGEEDPRWMVANQRYEKFVIKASRMREWSDKKVQEANVGGGVINVVRATVAR